ncbi:hypothetical protein [Clostridium sp. C2-6-12]|uniref:hypothetical protein n=1 Tax=Clostridium sp. C2-6-12 TaxID=2698832 RepID=UPI00136DF768|nr:hypothetical protein [Clostridium sp. C2-6-12]
MITLNKIIVTLIQVAGSDTVLITDVKPLRTFVDGKITDDISNYSYTVVCPDNKYETFSVKIESKQPIITLEELESEGAIKAKIKGFEGRFYLNRDKEVLFTSKATGLEIIG